MTKGMVALRIWFFLKLRAFREIFAFFVLKTNSPPPAFPPAFTLAVALLSLTLSLPLFLHSIF